MVLSHLFVLIARVQLFGILGGLFATLLGGVLQTIIIAIWKHWKDSHPEQFLKEAKNGEEQT